MKPRAVRNSRFDLPSEFTRALINFLIRHVYVYFTRTNSTDSFGIFFLFSFKNFQRDVYVSATKSVDTPVTVISYFFFRSFFTSCTCNNYLRTRTSHAIGLVLNLPSDTDIIVFTRPRTCGTSSRSRFRFHTAGCTRFLFEKSTQLLPFLQYTHTHTIALL